MENSFEGKAEIHLEWDVVLFLGHLHPFLFENPSRFLHVCHESDVRETIFSI